jgi:Symplekin tight junction protein C terminal
MLLVRTAPVDTKTERGSLCALNFMFADVQVTVLLLGQAVTRCLDMKDVFDRDTATNVLGRLVEEQELPTLIVRTLINVWHAHTELQRWGFTVICPVH